MGLQPGQVPQAMTYAACCVWIQMSAHHLGHGLHMEKMLSSKCWPCGSLRPHTGLVNQFTGSSGNPAAGGFLPARHVPLFARSRNIQRRGSSTPNSPSRNSAPQKLRSSTSIALPPAQLQLESKACAGLSGFASLERSGGSPEALSRSIPWSTGVFRSNSLLKALQNHVITAITCSSSCFCAGGKDTWYTWI